MTAIDDPARSVTGDIPAIQRSYCRLHRVTLPTRFPAQPRPDMARWRPPVVATRDGEELLCSSEHDGPHLWPDGEEAGEWRDA